MRRFFRQRSRAQWQLYSRLKLLSIRYPRGDGYVGSIGLVEGLARLAPHGPIRDRHLRAHHRFP